MRIYFALKIYSASVVGLWLSDKFPTIISECKSVPICYFGPEVLLHVPAAYVSVSLYNEKCRFHNLCTSNGRVYGTHTHTHKNGKLNDSTFVSASSCATVCHIFISMQNYVQKVIHFVIAWSGHFAANEIIEWTVLSSKCFTTFRAQFPRHDTWTANDTLMGACIWKHTHTHTKKKNVNQNSMFIHKWQPVESSPPQLCYHFKWFPFKYSRL